MGLRDLLPENFYLGTGADQCPLLYNPSYQDCLVEHFNCFTPTHNMKRARVCPGPNEFNFEPMDWMVQLCARHNITLRGHGLLIRGDKSFFLQSLSSTEVEAHMRDYVQKVVSRYRGIIPFYDVAVELVSDRGGLLDSFWKKHLGANFAHKVFRWAHEADPETKLFYCDYKLHDNLKLAGVFNLVDSIRANGTPVHGIAIQLHHNLSGSFKLVRLKKLIREIRSQGLEPHVSETTFWANRSIPEAAAQIAQAHVYQKVLDICLSEGVNFFNIWSSCDKFVWRHSEKTPGWWDEDLQPKKAFFRIESSLQKNLLSAKTE